jgi:hypothetical protein
MEVRDMKIPSTKEAPAILAPYSRCHRCGSPYRPEFAGLEWPKRCTYEPCRHLEYHHLNNIGVLLQTVTDGTRIGILTPIRGHAPMIGYPASTGGFQELEDHSSEWAGARETWEEVLRQLGILQPDENDLRMLCSRSTGPLIVGRRQNLVFSVNPNPIHVSAFEGFVGDVETTAIDFSWGPRVLAFPSHTYALARYFRDHQGMDVPRSHIVQPRTGDVVTTGEGSKTIFETHYDQPLLHKDIWCVLFEDRGVPQPVIHRDGGWLAA